MTENCSGTDENKDEGNAVVNYMKIFMVESWSIGKKSKGTQSKED